jgi:hypothetical protein
MFTFRSCIPEAVAPEAASPTLFGSASFRAATHCEPFRSATSYGWYLRPPTSFHLRWSGSSFSWLPTGGRNWIPVSNVPAKSLGSLRGVASADFPMLELPILSALPEPGIIQVWTGLAACTPPGWGLLVTGVANLPGHPAYEVLEGIIETDWFHGPVLTNLRFRRTDEIVHIEHRHPLLMARPIRHECYAAETLKAMSFVDFVSAAETDAMVSESMSVRRPSQPGGYRREVLRRRRSVRADD